EQAREGDQRRACRAGACRGVRRRDRLRHALMPPPENWLTKLTKSPVRQPRTHLLWVNAGDTPADNKGSRNRTCEPALALLAHAPRGLLVLEHGHYRRRSPQSQLLPPRNHVLVSLLARLGALGEGLDEAIVHAGIDQTFRSPRPDLRRVQAGIEIGAPGLAQDVDRLRRTRTRRHGPEHLVDIGRIDVVVDDD